MGSYPKISRQQILDSALQLLIREGFDAINIKTLASELGCSTQPISWNFGSIENLRHELAQKAYELAVNEATVIGKNPLETMYLIACNYLKLAIDRPNLWRFTTSNLHVYDSGKPLLEMFNPEINLKLVIELVSVTGFSEKDSRQFLEDSIMYVYGMSMLFALGFLSYPIEHLQLRIQEFFIRRLQYYGLSEENAKSFFEV